MDPAVNTTAAESATAAAAVNAVQEAEVDLTTLSDAEYHTYRMTGEMPQSKGEPKSEASAASKESSEAGKPAGSAPASEAGKEQKPHQKRDNAETRLQEILGDLKSAGLSPAELKTFKKEAAVAPKAAESAPAKQPEVKAAPIALEEPKEPKWEEFEKLGPDKAWEAYDAATRKYNRALAKYESQKAVADYQRRQLEAQQTERLKTELADGRKIYADFDEKAAPVLQTFIDDPTIHPLVKEVVGSSAIFPHLLYVIGGDKAQLDELLADARTNPVKALKKVAVLENLVMEELQKKAPGKEGSEAARGKDGKFLASDKKITSAPPPASEVAGKGQPTTDAAEEALKSEDTRGYIDAENARALREKRRY